MYEIFLSCKIYFQSTYTFKKKRVKLLFKYSFDENVKNRQIVPFRCY